MLDNADMALAIRAAIEQSGRSQKQIADEFGVTEQAVSGWLRTGKIDKRKIPKLAALTSKPLSHFGLGAEDTIVSGPPLRRITIWNDPDALPPDEYVFLRKIEALLSAGTGGPAIDDVDEVESGVSFRADYAAKNAWRRDTHFTMRADGVSMEPTIQDRAPVVVATNEKIVRSGKVYAIRLAGQDQPLLKRLDRLPGNRYRVRSDNPDPQFAPFDASESEVEVIGRAVWTPVEL